MEVAYSRAVAETKIIERISNTLSISNDESSILLNIFGRNVCVRLPSGKICTRRYYAELLHKVLSYKENSFERLTEEHADLADVDIKYILEHAKRLKRSGSNDS